MGLGTFLFMAALGSLGVIMKFVVPFIMDILSVPGKLVIAPDSSGKCGQSRFMFGVSLAVLLQSYVYFIYVAFVVRWTVLAMEDHGAQSVVLFAAIFAVIFPLGSRLQKAVKSLGEEERIYRRELDEDFHSRANERERKQRFLVKSLSATFLLTIVTAVVFFYIPRSISILYGKTFSTLGGLWVK